MQILICISCFTKSCFFKSIFNFANAAIQKKLLLDKTEIIKSSHPEVLLGKCVLKICSKFTGEHPRRSAISIKLQSNFIEITLQHRCSSVNFFREKKLIVSLVELNASFKKPQWNLYKVDTIGA